MVSEDGGPTVYPTGIGAATGRRPLFRRPEKAQDSRMKCPFSLGMRSKVLFAIGGLTLLAWSSPAGAVQEPDGTPLPQPVGQNEIGAVTPNGFKASDVTLEGLFAIRGEVIDTKLDAHQTPGTFSPQCGFTGTIVLRGGGCQNALGWYNATPNSTTPPAASQIYTLVPSNLQNPPPNGLSCQDQTFCPLAEMQTDPGHVGQHGWVNYTWNASSIATNPNYKGGQVGFALMPGTQCTQTKYSEAQLNTISTQYKVPWVTTLIYQSTVDPSAYYIAFEDLPMPRLTGSNKGVTATSMTLSSTSPGSTAKEVGSTVRRGSPASVLTAPPSARTAA